VAMTELPADLETTYSMAGQATTTFKAMAPTLQRSFSGGGATHASRVKT
jgi:hypothetical protein